MAQEKFDENLMRMIAAELHFSNCLIAAREMFGRGYFSLGDVEKSALHQTVFAGVAGNYQALTPDFLAAQQAQQPMGFRAPIDAKA